jgi:DNA polymerase III subunit delta
MAKALRTGFDVLLNPDHINPAPVVVIVGDGGFLQHETRRAIVARLCVEDADAAEVINGEMAELRDVLDAVGERSLFGGERRVVVLEDADKFVQAYRAPLEVFVANSPTEATLIMEVSSWPGNTRLAKAVDRIGFVIRCQAPERGQEAAAFNRQMKDWLITTSRRDFQVELAKTAVDELLDLAPPEAGILYQEVARLSLLAAPSGKIDASMVREHVGGWRTRKTWDMIDAAADGQAAMALVQLDRLLAAGEEAHGLLPQMASTLRRLALAVRLLERAERRGQGISLRTALEQAGVAPFKLSDAERQLRQIGRPRARRLYRWLLTADLELKGHNSSKDAARRVLETLIIRLSRQAQPESLAQADGRR